MASRRKRGLTPDDQKVWQQVAKSLTPLQRKPVSEATPDTASLPSGIPSGSVQRFDLPRSQTAVPVPDITYELAPDPIQAMKDATPALDKRTYDRFRKGKIAPERRIDLHGLTLAAAQRNLTSFILSSVKEGCRVVLVITGKGRTAPQDDGPIPRRPGAIRHHVPMWLASPPLKGNVVQVMPAQARDGGTGALYVYLRRKR